MQPKLKRMIVKKVRTIYETKMSQKKDLVHIRVTKVIKVFPTVTLKGRVFHPDSNDVHISSLI